MVYINDQFKFIFIENPKSASSCILNGITESLNIKLRRGNPITAHLTCQQIKELYPEKWEKYLKVSTYREPKERFNSVKNHHHFKDHYTMDVLSKHLANPNDCVYCKPQELFTESVDFLIHFDNLQQDFETFCNIIGIKPVILSVVNETLTKIF
jgi:hypothetical protein